MELVWFRKDLRVADNPALYQSCLNGPTRAIYFITPTQWQLHNIAPIQIDLMERALNELSLQLGDLGIPFDVITVAHFNDIPKALNTYCLQHKVDNIYANSEVEIDENQRDLQAQQLLQNNQITLKLFQADCLINPGDVVTQQGEMYKVFTPFKNCCLKMLRQTVNLQPYPIPIAQQKKINNASITLPLTKRNSADWPASEWQTHQLLQRFIEQDVEHYHERRDFPAQQATSKLGPCLALGLISAKQCVYYLLQAFPTLLDGNATGPVIWLNELLWREFYRHIMVLTPSIGKGGNYNLRANNIIWDNSTKNFKAWCNGETGYPLVDAAMLQLNQTGWMHNRLRMVCASFLTKHLLIDWRWGERYFKAHLIDGDFASNNGGWQWAASTGCDSQPYFRIFNPTLQSKRFDENGEFIRHYLKQRQNLNHKQVHDPMDEIVDHKFARERALQAFSVLKLSGPQGG